MDSPHVGLSPPTVSNGVSATKLKMANKISSWNILRDEGTEGELEFIISVFVTAASDDGGILD